jgi:general secretion pathway protein K
MRTCFVRGGRRGHDEPDGFIIVAVLWLVAALATVAGIYAFYVRETSLGFASYTDRLHAQMLSKAAVELAAYRLLSVEDRTLARGGFSFPANNARITVNVQPEAARIDLNAAPKELLAGLFIGLGVRPDTAEEHASRILAWRTPTPPGATDEETSLYRVAGKTYGPRRAPFQHADELSLVLGVTPALAEQALPYVTVYSGRAEIDAISAPPQVMAAVPGINPEMLQGLLTRRDTSPQQMAQAPANSFGAGAKYVTVDFGNSARVTIDVDIEARRRVRSEAVIVLLPGDPEPYRVLSWREEIDIGAPEQPARARR